MPSSQQDIQTADPQKALRDAETTLSRIQRYAQAAEDDRITPGEAIEQILDEFAAHPALRRVRKALGRSFDSRAPH